MNDVVHAESPGSNLKSFQFWENGFAIFIALFTLGSIVLHAYLSSKFFVTRAYSVNDIFFDADPPVIGSHLLVANLRMTFRHPLIVFITFPVSIAGAALSRVLHFNLLVWMVILVGPIASGIKTFFLGLTARALRIPIPLIALLLLIDLFSLSQLVFGSIPETFAYTAAGLAALTFLAALTITGHANRRIYWWWVLTGVLIMGATITNIVFLILFLFPALVSSGMPWRKALQRSLIAAVLSCSILVAIAVVGFFAIHPNTDQIGTARTALSTGQNPNNLNTITYLRASPAAAFLSFPRLLAYSFAGPHPAIIQHPEKPLPIRRDAYFVMPAKIDAGWIPSLLLTPLCLLAGAIFWGRTNWKFGLPAIAVLALLFDLAVNSLWKGPDIFLYALHYQPIFLILFLGIFLSKNKAVYILPILLLILEIAENINNLSFMLRTIS